MNIKIVGSKIAFILYIIITLFIVLFFLDSDIIIEQRIQLLLAVYTLGFIGGVLVTLIKHNSKTNTEDSHTREMKINLPYEHKLHTLEDLIREEFNIEEYKCEFDVELGIYVYTLKFKNFSICVKLKSMEIENLSKEQTIDIFKHKIQEEINKIYRKN